MIWTPTPEEVEALWETRRTSCLPTPTVTFGSQEWLLASFVSKHVLRADVELIAARGRKLVTLRAAIGRGWSGTAVYDGSDLAAFIGYCGQVSSITEVLLPTIPPSET